MNQTNEHLPHCALSTGAECICGVPALDLEAIEGRHRHAVRANVEMQSFRIAQALKDEFALIAEVRRLREQAVRMVAEIRAAQRAEDFAKSDLKALRAQLAVPSEGETK